MLRRLNKHLIGSAASIERLEERQLMAVSPVIAGTKVKGINLSSGGVSTNQTLITVPFTGNVVIADASKIQVRGYAINPLNGKQRKMVIGVVKSAVLAADHRFLQITTDRLMRKGGSIMLLDGALKDDNGDTLTAQTVKAVKGQNKERFTLACRGFVPSDLTKFTPDLYAGSPAPGSASGTIPEATVTSQLTAFLQKKVNAGTLTATQRNNALNRYNAAATKGIVPDANMRAALVSLTGTLAEPAIASMIDGTNLSGKPYTIVSFDVPPDGTVPVAQTVINPTTGRLRTVIKPQFAGEPFQVVSAFLAHEALHQDTSVALQEEEVANIAEILTYAQQALADPTFLSSKTALTNLENDRLYALLESGRTIFPYVGVLNGPIRNAAGGVFVGAKAQTGGVFTSYMNFIERSYLARGSQVGLTTGNALLKQYYTAITGKAAPATLNFNEALINDIDSFQQIVTTKAAVTLAGNLRLGLG